jgi:hypothetical protein
LFGGGADVGAFEVGRGAFDSGEAHAEFFFGERFEALAVAPGGVEVVVVGSGEREVVAAFGLAGDGVEGGEFDAMDDRAGRVWGWGGGEARGEPEEEKDR